MVSLYTTNVTNKLTRTENGFYASSFMRLCTTVARSIYYVAPTIYIVP